MATFDPETLAPTQPLEGDDAVPIGSVAPWQSSSARRVLLTDASDVVFGPEEPITVGYAWRRVGPVGRWLCEVKADPAAGPSHGDELVVTEFPRGNGWSFVASFRRSFQKGELERPDLTATTWELANALPHDPWEKGRRVTAAVEPSAPDAPRRKVRGGTKTLWVFGVCGSFRKLEHILLALPRARELPMHTRVVRPDTISQGRRRVLAAETIPVHPRVLEDATSLLHLAVRQALAGPVEDDGGNSTSDLWVGRPVMDLVEHIYFRHLTNGTKVEMRRDHGHLKI
jgi:hypothetical protein